MLLLVSLRRIGLATDLDIVSVGIDGVVQQDLGPVKNVDVGELAQQGVALKSST